MTKKKLVNFSKNADMVRIAEEFSQEFSLQLHDSFNTSVILTRTSVCIVTPSIKNILLLLMRTFFLRPTIVGIHDVVSHERRDFYKIWLYNFIICLFASKVIVFSKFSQEELLKKFPIRRENIMIYYFGKNLKPVNKFKTIDCLFFGRGLPYTGMQLIPKIAKNLPELQFKVISKNSRKLTDTTHNLSIIPNFVDDAELFDAIASARVVLLPYISATQSGAIPLAAGSNTQIVAFDVGGLAEQCSGAFGKFASPLDLDEFVKLIQHSIINPQTIDYNKWRVAKLKEQTVQV